MMESSPPDAELAATDRSALDRLKRFGGAKLLNEMIALFLVAAPERIQAARVAAANGDAESAERALHSLKSSSAQLGAMRLQRLSAEGEHRAGAGALGGIAQLTDELEQELATVQDWLARTRDEGDA